MAALSSPRTSQSQVKPLNPKADPFFSLKPFFPHRPSLPRQLYVVSSMFPDHPRPVNLNWQFHPYPSVCLYNVKSQWILPNQVGFSFSDGGDKLVAMEGFNAIDHIHRDGEKLKRGFMASNKQKRKIKSTKWVEKKSETPHENIECDDFVDRPYQMSPWSLISSEISTVMIKNIPNQFERRDLLNILDEYCKMANRKGCCISEYDFVYLPMDYGRDWDERRVSNLGYAFVNFTTSEAALLFYHSYQNFKWPVYFNQKICQVAAAKFQGREALMSVFKNKKFWCRYDHYLPVLLSPASDGCRPYRSINVGIRKHQPPKKPIQKRCH